MRSYDRPYFESYRERDRGHREREIPSSPRGDARWRDDDDDRGPWISRGRDDFDPREDPREDRFGRDRRFERFEEWERPVQMREFSAHPSSGRRFAGRSPQYSYSERREPYGRYAGRGPKGYHRSDERIREEVCERLTADPDIDAVDVEVAVQDGEVTLSGTIRERQMKRYAEDCAESVSGVQQVHNQLRVEARGDERLAPADDERQPSGFWRRSH
jgi:hypothetical protein